MTKKRIIFSIGLFTLMLITTGCGGNNQKKGVKDNQNGQKITSKDVVSQKNDVVDGEEVTLYELKDGTNVMLPKGVDLDDVDVQAPTDDEKKLEESGNE